METAKTPLHRKKILIIEDEPAIAENITYALEKEGFITHWSSTAEKAINASKDAFDLILLDVGLPDMNGFDLCKELQKKVKIPIIFITARGEEIDRVVGLEIGAEDYLVKPFSLRELIARIKIVLRRSLLPTIDASSSKSLAQTGSKAFSIDEERYQIHFLGQKLDLSLYEYRLLQILIRRPGRVYSRDQLMELAWESPETSMDRTIDAHIKNIRKELRKIDPSQEWIETHRGLGYALKEEQ